MKRTIRLDEIEEKTTRTGQPMLSVKTNKGVMQCFEDSVSIELLENEKKTVSVEVIEKNGYKNIVEFYEVFENGAEEEKIVKEEPSGASKKTKKKDEFDPTSMYVSYAKDIFIALVNAGADGDAQSTRNIAISAVEDFERAFK